MRWSLLTHLWGISLVPPPALRSGPFGRVCERHFAMLGRGAPWDTLPNMNGCSVDLYKSVGDLSYQALIEVCSSAPQSNTSHNWLSPTQYWGLIDLELSLKWINGQYNIDRYWECHLCTHLYQQSTVCFTTPNRHYTNINNLYKWLHGPNWALLPHYSVQHLCPSL